MKDKKSPVKRQKTVTPIKKTLKKSAPKRSTKKSASPRKRSTKKSASPRKRSTRIQSIIFKRDKWTEKTAKKWLKDHNYKNTKIDYNENYLRFRQIATKKNKQYRTINFGKYGDIKAIIEII